MTEIFVNGRARPEGFGRSGPQSAEEIAQRMETRALNALIRGLNADHHYVGESKIYATDEISPDTRARALICAAQLSDSELLRMRNMGRNAVALIRSWPVPPSPVTSEPAPFTFLQH